MNVKLQRENPCYKCQDRSPICHSICEKYRVWSEKIAQHRELRHQQKEDKRKTYTYMIDKRDKRDRL